ncbi:MAG: dUTP diphosphatase [Acidimicrobiaceae bacterium]|jgi:dUTP pyrophosphatase
MEILAKALHPDAILPTYANEGDAGCDLVAIEDAVLKAGGGRAMVGTGVAIAIPQGHGGFVLPRSGLASKHGVTCSNAPGLVDAGYRGELKVALVNLDPTNDYEVKKGDRIAQLVILAVPSASFSLVEELPEATRGEGGFGSTGR